MARSCPGVIRSSCLLSIGIAILTAVPRCTLFAEDRTATPDTAKIDLAAKPGFDVDGDPLPSSAIARLGTKRFRVGRSKRAGSLRF